VNAPRPRRSALHHGHFELNDRWPRLDGLPEVRRCGHVVGQSIEEATGGTNARIKHLSTFDIEPMTIDFGNPGANDSSSDPELVGQGLGSSLRSDHARNFEFQSTLEHEFRDALILETKFPTLDGASKEAAYLQLKIQPES